MPELPEVERGRRLAASVVEGRVVQHTHCHRDPIVFQGAGGVRFSRALRGKRILKVLRWGKQLWFELDGPPHPLFHFGMTGAFRTREATPLRLKSGPDERSDVWPPRFTKIHLWMDDGNELVMTDARGLGRILLRDDPVNQPPLCRLGFDPYIKLASPAVFRKGLRHRKTPVTSLLLDQQFCAGIGNWMAAEILYQARIDPRRLTTSLSDTQIARIRKCLRSIVRRAVEANAEDSSYLPGWLFHHRWGRNQDAKTTSGECIELVEIGGRTSAWVPSVQC